MIFTRSLNFTDDFSYLYMDTSDWTFNFKINFIHTKYAKTVRLFQQLFLKQLKVELEESQPIRIQGEREKGHLATLYLQ